MTTVGWKGVELQLRCTNIVDSSETELLGRNGSRHASLLRRRRLGLVWLDNASDVVWSTRHDVTCVSRTKGL